MGLKAPAPASRLWKGKAPERVSRRTTSPSNNGVVLSLEMLTDSLYSSVYTVPVAVGTSPQNFSLQVDTGSADLWIASTSCSTSACSQTNGRLYDPSSSRPTMQTFTISYAEGEVSGPIVWDTVDLGGYAIENQALAAASSVTSEPLEQDYSGILGLALPLDSIILQKITPAVSVYPNGAVLSSKLFSLTPTSTAPGAPFFSLALERPGSDAIPSVLGIGRHPDGLIDDPSKIHYASLVEYSAGSMFWQAVISAITVYVDGKEVSIQLGTSVTGASAPSGVLDSGTPVILATESIANAIYGALGIGPASDGQYYIPCTTPLNMTITLDDRPPIALHPLDLSYPAPSYASTSMCTGLIQNSALLGSSEVNVADMILGVPFLRNTYMVMAYEPPDAHGLFPGNDSTAAAGPISTPRLGLLNLTNPTTALADFHRVRVLGQPLGNMTAAQGSARTGAGHRLATGFDVLIGVGAFVGLCVALLGVHWALVRRPRARARHPEDAGAQDLAHALARGSTHDGPFPSEDTLRRAKHRTSGSQASRADELGAKALFAEPDSPRGGGAAAAYAGHLRTLSGESGVAVPLLAYAHRRSLSADVTEFGLGHGAEAERRPQSMAGVGTPPRGGRVGGRRRSVMSEESEGSEDQGRARPPRGPRPEQQAREELPS